MATFKIKKTDGSWEYIGSSSVKVDTTLTQAGMAADAKAVGDALASKQPTGDYALNSSLGALATKNSVEKTDLASDVQTSLGKADTALQSFSETDPTVPAWAKAATKPTYTAAEVGITTTTSVTSGSSALITSGAVYTGLSGKANSSHKQAASTITAGTLAGKVVANATAVKTLGDAQVRNIWAGTADISEVENSLKEGDIYLRYEGE